MTKLLVRNCKTTDEMKKNLHEVNKSLYSGDLVKNKVTKWNFDMLFTTLVYGSQKMKPLLSVLVDSKAKKISSVSATSQSEIFKYI